MKNKLLTINFILWETLILIVSIILFIIGYFRVKSGILYLSDSFVKHFANVGLLYMLLSFILIFSFFAIFTILFFWVLKNSRKR